jgi:adenosine deaminase
MKAKEIVSLLYDGVRVTVNSDDPAYFRGYIGENFAALGAKADLTAADVTRLARNAFEIAWISTAAREAFLAEVDAYASAHDVS